ncbi:MAG: protein kinase [Candidatus Omnitrophica bacterium]|nr:protein kinase [Candidatus Omnitrophota bacterium]
MNLYCAACREFVPAVQNRCVQCGDLLSKDQGGNYFLSGDPNPPGFQLELNEDHRIAKRYIPRKLLHQGPFISVHQMHDALSGEEVAAKIAPSSSLFPILPSLQVQHEFQLSRRIANFQHVIRPHNLHLEPWDGMGLVMISMELAQEGTFRQWLIDRRSEPDQRRELGLMYFQQIVQGFLELERCGIAPADVKPENCLVVQGAIKVTDYGASNSTDAELHLLDQKPMDLGTPVYMSPEHFTASSLKAITIQSVIYSLGILLYEIVHPSGQPPFTGDLPRLRECHLHLPAPKIPGLEERIVRVLDRCLEKDPADRYASLQELLEDLEPSHPSAPSESHRSTEKPPPDSQKLDALWADASWLYAQEKLDQAGKVCQTILDLNPSHNAAGSLLNELQARSQQAQEFYQKIERDMERCSLSDLSELIQEAYRLYPEHPAGHYVIAKVQLRAKNYRKSMEEGCRALSQGQWQSASASFQEASTLNPGDVIVKQSIALTDEIRQIMDALQEEIQQAQSSRDDSTTQLLTEARDAYLQSVQQHALQVLRELDE